MIVRHDYRCERCGSVGEATVDGDAIPAMLEHWCGDGAVGAARRIWLRAPAVHGDTAPYFNVQLGCMVNSKQHFAQLLKERGKVALGPDEVRHTQSQSHEPGEPKLDETKFREAMEKSWAQMESGNLPMEEAKPLPDYIRPEKGLVA